MVLKTISLFFSIGFVDLKSEGVSHIIPSSSAIKAAVLSKSVLDFELSSALNEYVTASARDFFSESN